MNRRFLFFSVLSCALLVSGCGTRIKSPEQPAWINEKIDDPRRMGAFQTSENYRIDIKQSVVYWVGKKKWPYTEYRGTLDLAKGELKVSNGNITAGDFTVDMRSLDIVSLKEDPKDYQKMMDRLKNYFFYVQDYPTILFTVSSVQAANKAALPNATHVITGKLTIKGTTNAISVSANILIRGDELKAYSRFSINRNDYHITYDEDSFFGGIGNAAIKDSIDLALELIGMRDTTAKPAF